jgi:hypothetical protein
MIRMKQRGSVVQRQKAVQKTVQRIGIPTSADIPHFNGAWTIEPLSLCDELIAFFESHPDHQAQGKIAGGLNTESKHSTDLTIRPWELQQADHLPVRNYLDALFACHTDYLDQWPFLKGVMPSMEVSSFNIQRYQPGGHFLKVHSERTTLATSHRVLAWMTYLNDVEDGGSTEFVQQGIEVQPSKGKTLIWPAEWTHAHRANVLNSGTKYIITGWIHFPPRKTA